MSSLCRAHPAGRALFFLGGRQVGAHAFEYFRRHADRFAQRRMRMDRLADIDRIAAHLDREANLADQIARVRCRRCRRRARGGSIRRTAAW